MNAPFRSSLISPTHIVFLAAFLFSTSIIQGQGFNISGDDILNQKFEKYLQYNTEYRAKVKHYQQQQKTVDSCYRLLEKSALTIRNATKTLPWKVRTKVLKIIEGVKNDKSGDIYNGFKTFDDPTMNTIKATIRVSTLYECEIAILKARLRMKKLSEWANASAKLINSYYYKEFIRHEYNHKLSTYQQLYPVEQNIEKLLIRYQQGKPLPIESNREALTKLIYVWELNTELLRTSDERQSLLNLLKVRLE